MTRDELKQIVSTEGLAGLVLVDEGMSVRENAVVLEPRGGGWWRAYVTQERAAVAERTVRNFSEEPDALEYVLTKLRELNEALRILREA